MKDMLQNIDRGFDPADPDGLAEELGLPSPDEIPNRARDMGIDPTPALVSATLAARANFLSTGGKPDARCLSSLLRDALGSRGAHEAFGGNPVERACRLIGIPEPAGTREPGFGSCL